MIDLRNKGLPNTIEVGGSLFLIKTDFRLWLKFGEMIGDKENKLTLDDFAFLFVNEMPLIPFLSQLIEFYTNINLLPKKSGSNNAEEVVDYIIDGEYIVASFMQAYHIDLTTCDMHWHLFKALFLGLPESTIMKDIIGYRSWTKTKKSEDTIRTELKRAWSLPKDKQVQQKEQELLDEINNEFYNS